MTRLHTDVTRRLPTLDTTERPDLTQHNLAGDPGALIDVGALAERLGVSVRFDPADVDEWIAERRVEAVSTIGSVVPVPRRATLVSDRQDRDRLGL